MSRRIGQALKASLLVLLSACGATNATNQSSPGSIHVTAAGPHVIEIQMTDGLRFVPDRIAVDVGQTVKFLATNLSSTEHDFFIGNAAAQDGHEAEMLAGTNPNMHFRPDDMVLMPGTSNQLTYTFEETGVLIFGCHEKGHYAAGMRGTIEVMQP